MESKALLSGGKELRELRRRKLILAASILALGMAAACGWHGFHRWVLHHGYPQNTFLFQGISRFGDFDEVLRAARVPNPYGVDFGSGYFPFAYLFFRAVFPAALFSIPAARYFFLGVGLLGALLLLMAFLRSALGWKGGLAQSLRLLGGGLLGLLLLYPVWFCVDRGNIELLLVLLLAVALHLLGRHRYPASLAFLVPAICFKVYPAVLLALYLRRGRMRWIVLAVGAALLVSLAGFACFPGPWRANWEVFRERAALVSRWGILGNECLDGTATLWNAYKVSAAFLHFHTFQGSWRWHDLPAGYLSFHQRIYSLSMMVGAAAVTAYVCLVESEFLRRAVVLLLFMVVASPIGQDYKLLQAALALGVLVLVPTRRRHDLLAVALLAFALIPKKEWLLTFVGPTFGNDVSIGIFLTPLAMLLAAGFLAWDGFRQWNPRWGWRRLCNLASFRGRFGPF